MYLPSWHGANIWNVFLNIIEVDLLIQEIRDYLSSYQLHFDIFGSKRVKQGCLNKYLAKILERLKYFLNGIRREKRVDFPFRF